MPLHPVRRQRLRLSLGLPLMLAVAAASGCEGPGSKSWAKDGAGGRHGKGEKEGLQVATGKLEPATIERFYRTSGTLQAIRAAEIAATQVGIIRSLGVEEGDKVERSQVLARLDGREQALNATAAAIQLDNLERELQRLESVKGGAIAPEEIDKQRYAVEEAKVAAKLSKVQAKQTTVRAPFDGTVVERLVDEGTLATTATPLFRIADLSVLELDLHLPERDAASVKVGADVDIELVDGTTFTASIARKAPIVDPMTGTVKFTVQTREYPEQAMPGAFARARVLVAAREAAPSIPRSAVFEVEGKPHVYVIEEGKARRVAVELGLEGSDRVEVLSGLDASHVIVLQGKDGITEGMPLKAAPATSEQPSGSS